MKAHDRIVALEQKLYGPDGAEPRARGAEAEVARLNEEARRLERARDAREQAALARAEAAIKALRAARDYFKRHGAEGPDGGGVVGLIHAALAHEDAEHNRKAIQAALDRGALE